MRIEYKDLVESMQKVAMNNVAKQLIEDGYKVDFNRKFGNFSIDLFAEKGSEKIIYEFKVHKRPIQRHVYDRLQEITKDIGAKLKVVYINQPNEEKEIEFEGIEYLLMDTINDDFPDELDRLSTHTTVYEVSDVSCRSVKVSSDKLTLEGDCTVTLQLKYGSKSDERDGNDFHDYYGCGLNFKIILNNEREIIDKDFIFDVESFYE